MFGDGAFEALIVLSILIFIIIFFSCFLSIIIKGTFCCKEQIHNMDDVVPV